MISDQDTNGRDDAAASPGEDRKVERGSSRHSAAETYQTVAETVGMVPSVRRSDNLRQAVAVGLGTLVGAALGCLWGSGLVSRIEAFTGIGGISETHGPRVSGALFGAVAGLIASAAGTGLILMVAGWVRAARKRSG